MRNIFDADDTDAILLNDASNAFNALTRAAALHNTGILCPTMVAYAINTYRLPSRLFIVGGQELKSSEGTTQGDPLSMANSTIYPTFTPTKFQKAMLVCR